MKTIVIFKSATGFTEKYAQWIAEALSADLFSASEVTPRKMKDYDCIIFGGRLHAVGIDGMSLITKNFEQLQDKRLIVFATGASLSNDAVIKAVRDKNLSPQQQARVQLFYLRGGFNFKALPLFDKLLMTMLKSRILKKQRQGKQLTPDETGMLKLIETAGDFTDKDGIEEILRSARMAAPEQ